MRSSLRPNDFSVKLSFTVLFFLFPMMAFPWVSPGFETGNLSGWTMTSGTGATPTCAPNALVVGPGPAPHSQGTICVAPTICLDRVRSGSFSAQLDSCRGDNDHLDWVRLEQTDTVPSNGQCCLSFWFAAILSGHHFLNGEDYGSDAYILAEVLVGGAVVGSLRYSWYDNLNQLVDDGADPFGPPEPVSDNPPMEWRHLPWTPFTINLCAYAGRQATLRFTVYDCDMGGHNAFGYLDDLSWTACPPANLSLTKANDPPGAISQGATITYTLSYANNGTQPISGVRVTDTIPPGTALVPGSITSTPLIPDVTVNGSDITWNIGQLAAGASGTLSFQVVAMEACRTLINVAREVDLLNPDGILSNAVTNTVGGCSPTPTRTLSATSTRTSTLTVTPTRTASATSSATSTASRTSTASWTRTLTASQTSTPSATRTGTPTSTQTSSLTRTATPTVTTTLTFTRTSSMTSTATSSRTATPSSTASATTTVTRTATSSATPTVTLTFTFTRTGTSSATSTLTLSPTGTLPPTASRTATPSATSSRTSTATSSRTATASSTTTASLTATTTATVTRTSTSSTTSTVTMTFTFTRTGTSSATSTSTPSPTGTLPPTMTRTSSMTSTTTFTRTASSTPTVTATATLTTTSSASRTSTTTATSTLSRTTTSSATSTGTAVPTATRTSSLTATTTFTRTASSTPTVTATASTTRTLTPTSTATSTSSVTTTRTATASSTSTSSRTATPSFTPTVTRTFSPTATASPTATDTFTVTPTPTLTSTPTATPTPTPGLALSKSPSLRSARRGDLLTYSLGLTVIGSPASNVEVVDLLPSEATFVGFGPIVPPVAGASFNASGSRLTWTFPALSPGVYRLDYEVRVREDLTMGVTLLNTAQTSLGGRPSGAVTALVDVPAPFRVGIALYNGAGERVRTLYSGSSFEKIDTFDLSTARIMSLDGRIDLFVEGRLLVSWDGEGATGEPVSNGDYFLKMDVLDPYGLVTNVTRTVLVSRSLSTVEVLVLNEAGEVVRRLYREVVDAVDGSQRSVRLSTSVIHPTLPAGSGPSSSVTILVDIPSGPFQTAWDGTNEQGGLVTNGRYFVQVRWRSRGEEQTVVDQVTVLQEGERAGRGEVTARLDPVGGTVTTLSLEPAQGSTLMARLYNVAGELVRKAQGPPGQDRVDLDTLGLASGFYLAVVEVEGAQGPRERRIVRLMVRR